MNQLENMQLNFKQQKIKPTDNSQQKIKEGMKIIESSDYNHTFLWAFFVFLALFYYKFVWVFFCFLKKKNREASKDKKVGGGL